MDLLYAFQSTIATRIERQRFAHFVFCAFEADPLFVETIDHSCMRGVGFFIPASGTSLPKCPAQRPSCPRRASKRAKARSDHVRRNALRPFQLNDTAPRPRFTQQFRRDTADSAVATIGTGYRAAARSWHVA